MVLFCWRVKGSLLASSPFMESDLRKSWENVRGSSKASRGGGKESLQRSQIFISASPIHTVKYYWLNRRWLMTFLDDPPQCLRSFRNTMLTEIGNIMIAPYHSLLLWSVNDFWGLCGSAVWSQPRGTYKVANQKAEKGLPGKHYDTKSHHICCVSPQQSHWQTADTFYFLGDSFHALWLPSFSGVDIKIYETSFFSHPLHSHVLSCAALSDFLRLPLMESLLAG